MLYSMPVSDVLTFVISLVIIRKTYQELRESVPEETGEDCRMAVSEQLQPVITAAIIITAMTSQERSAVRTIYRQR